MNNIDILAELVVDAKKEISIEERQAIVTLIAENKELKEENLHWKGQYHLLSRKIDVIPKSKVKEVIEELNNEIEQLRIEKNVTFDSGIYKLTIQKEALQSLLGKE